VRAQFELDPDYLHFTTYVLGAHAAPVRAAIERHRQGFDRNPRLYLEMHEGEMDRNVPQAVARFLGTSPEGRTPSAAPGPAHTPGGFHSFEHRWALIEALDFARALDTRRVADRTHQLARRLKAGLGRVRGVELRTPASDDISAGIVCCEIAGRDPGEVVMELNQRHRVIASVTPYASRFVRFGPTYLNTDGEVDELVRAVAATA
jgi:hypothetical protein